MSLHPLTPRPAPCESSPDHAPAVGELQIGDSVPMTLCPSCLRYAMAVWIDEARPERGGPTPVTYRIEPVAA